MNIVPSLHPRDEHHLIKVYYLFDVLLDVVCRYLLRMLASMFISDIGLKFSFFVVSLSGFGIRLMLASLKELGVFHLLEYFGIISEGWGRALP